MPVDPLDKPISKLREEIIDQLILNYSHGELSLEAFERRLDQALDAETHDALLSLTADLDLVVDSAFREQKKREFDIMTDSHGIMNEQKIVNIFGNSKREGVWDVPKEIQVFNIFGKLTRFPSTRPTMKRAFDHFLYFIDSVCYFRQKQKPWVTRKIPGLDKRVRGKKCDLYDYEIAYRLYVQRVLKRTGLTDIASSTRTVYEKVRQMTRQEAETKGLAAREVSFMQRDLREFTGLRHEFVKKHLRLLLNYEYIIAVSGRSRGTRNVYRLRDDVDMIELDISMITTPEEMKEIFEEADKQEKEIFGEEEEWD